MHVFRMEFNKQNSDGSTPKYSQDDSVISYGAYNSLNNLCTKCSNRDCQRDFIQKDLAYHQHPNTFDSNTCIDLANIQKLFRTNPKMLRVLGRGCLLILFVLFSCLGLLYSASTKETKDLIDNQIELGGPNNFHAGNKLSRRVSLEEFRALSRNAKSYRDIYRIFLKNKQVSDAEIDKFLTLKSFKEGIKKKERDYDEYNDEEGAYYTDDIEKVAEEAYSHYLNVKEHPLGSCSEPTPELHHIPPEGNKLFFPEYTILHHCRNERGCCWNSAKECAEKEIQIIAQSFLVYELDHQTSGDEVYIPEANKVDIKFFKNVTKCECKDLKMLPRCDKECPFPFVKKRQHTECVCDCRDHNSLNCLEIKYGIKQLPNKDIRCIKDGRCMKPKCDTGEIVMEKGYCPGAPNAKLRLYQRTKRDLRMRRRRQLISLANMTQRTQR